MKKLSLIMLGGAIVMALTACGQRSKETASVETTAAVDAAAKATTGAAKETVSDKPESVTVTHGAGTTEVPFDPQRIAVLDLAALDILDSLGLGDRIVGIPKASQIDYLMDYIKNDDIVNMGALKEVDMEALMSVEPDLIFIGRRLEGEYENLSAIAPVVLGNLDYKSGYMESFKRNVMNIGSIFGVEDLAKQKLDGFDQRIADLKAKADGKTAVVGMVTSGSLNTLGNHSRGSIISNEVGFENIATDVNSTHGDTSSFELLLQLNPDYIFALDRDAAINTEGANTAQQVLENEIVMKTDAYKNGNIVYLTPGVWYLSEGGITATDTMLKDLEQGILK